MTPKFWFSEDIESGEDTVMEDGDPTIDQCYPTEDVQHLSDKGMKLSLI